MDIDDMWDDEEDIKPFTTPKASPASAPEGWKLVPVEPTENMWLAGGVIRGDVCESYRKMLAAAPTPPVSEDRKDAERYRWLCDNSNDTQRFAHFFEGVPAKKCTPVYKERIDAAIDTAMQEDKP